MLSGCLVLLFPMSQFTILRGVWQVLFPRLFPRFFVPTLPRVATTAPVLANGDSTAPNGPETRLAGV